MFSGVLASCSGYAVALHNQNPDSRHEALLIEPSVIDLRIPNGMRNLPEESLDVEVTRRRSRPLRAEISREDIGNNILRWRVDIAPRRWSQGGYNVVVSSDGKPIHELHLDFGYDLIGPWDY
jgi:hypothetical protein